MLSKIITNGMIAFRCLGEFWPSSDDVTESTAVRSTEVVSVTARRPSISCQSSYILTIDLLTLNSASAYLYSSIQVNNRET
ncbi:uncharacterized protein BT62DRAFT_765863 [Guyanagaster necrorhizus]|uniref:Uncharacterized protein n=1 Tax=Guyanagaster necrorhizus TaxID=856835 RepID=A0A9P8AUC4_9AGAR|nr:uncharacterized protein BT62DRAFT_765863 [Guyanagaster necrorhizus MCA 3950]KAG7448339.1 hypothetical protein BT62DRAFT_765863 [Guyanagaster necrorhizus MCA 3950]